jgi:uncharacterized protein (DUF362 family)
VKKITRRRFIKDVVVAGGVLGSSSLFMGAGKSAFATGPPFKTVMVTGDRITATRTAIQLLGGMERFVKKGNRVILKPNMSFPHPPDRATNTHPEVVAIVAELCVQAGASEIIILDYPFSRPAVCLRRSGIRDACSGLRNVHTVALAEEKFFKEVSVPRGKALKKVKLMKDVLESDVFINIPTAKSHATTGVSLGMKGLMGVIWDRKYFHSQDIHQAIADLSSVVKVDLTLLDASRALATGGPAGPGRIVTPQTIVAGIDPVAVDALGVGLVEWYGQKLKPSEVKHIVAAHDMRLGSMNVDQMNIIRKNT